MWFIKLLSRQPFWLIYIYSDILCFITYYIVGYRKKLVMKNLDIVFPDKSKKEKVKISKKFYRNLTDIALESWKAISISKEEMQKRVIYRNPEILLDRLAQGNSVVVLTAHQANWEWLLLGWSLILKCNIDAVYKPLSIKALDKFMVQIRERFGAVAVPNNMLLREVIKHKNETTVIALVADQRPWGFESDYWTTFFEKDAAFFTGAENLAKKFNFPVIFTSLKRIKRGYYEILTEEVADPPYLQDKNQILDSYVKRLENMIVNDPENWLWTHDRWKYSRLDRQIANQREIAGNSK